MAVTYEPIATTTLSSASGTIAFNSIPGTYTDLKIICVVTATDASTFLRMTFNSDTATNYSYTSLRGNGTSATKSIVANTAIMLPLSYTLALPTTLPAFGNVDIFNYAGSTYKTVLALGANDQNGSGEINAMVNMWRSTSAVTSIQLVANSTNTFTAGSTFTLYGITKA